jgi:hypothetical protein
MAEEHGMKKFGYTVVAVGCLALSMAACAPAFKGEGTMKPNLRKAANARQKALANEAEEGAHISKITREGNEITLKLKKADDLAEADREIKVTLGENPSAKVEDEKISQDSSKKYSVSVQCIDEACTSVAAILTVAANVQSEASGGQEEAPAAAAAQAAENAAENTSGAQAVPTPSQEQANAEPAAQVEKRVVGKVVVFDEGSNEGRQITHIILDSSASYEANLEALDVQLAEIQSAGR